MMGSGGVGTVFMRIAMFEGWRRRRMNGRDHRRTGHDGDGGVHGGRSIGSHTAIVLSHEQNRRHIPCTS